MEDPNFRYRDDLTDGLIPVSKWLNDQLDDFRSGQAVRGAMEEVSDDVIDNRWAVVDVMRDAHGEPIPVGYDVDDYGTYNLGNGHACEYAMTISNGEAIEKAAKKASGHLEDTEGYLVYDHMLFYDAGDARIRQAVTELADSLGEYPILDEMRHSEIERQLGREVFELSLQTLDEHRVPSYVVVDRWEELSERHCPECGFSHDFEDVAKDMALVECAQDACSNWTPDDALYRRRGECGECDHMRCEARSHTWAVYHFDPEDGNGLVIEFEGDHYEWDAHMGEWKRMHTTVGVNPVNKRK